MTIDSFHIEVAVALPVHRTFSYSVPVPLDSMVSPGMRVLVPFARRQVTGYVLGRLAADTTREVKHIADVLDRDPLFPATMVPFFRWIADYYIYPIGEVIKCALPGGLTVYDQSAVQITPSGEHALQKKNLSPSERFVLSRVQKGRPCMKDLHNLARSQHLTVSLIHTLENRGWIVQERVLKGDRTKPKMARYVSLVQAELPSGRCSPSRKMVFDALTCRKEMSVSALKEGIPGAAAIVRSLEKAGVVETFQKRVFRDPFGEPIVPDTAPILTDEQRSAVRTVVDAMGDGFSTHLLAGVTGSGKTEVYLQLAAACVKQNKSVLVLVPEIALMSQMERRFRARFGNKIAVLHSGLSMGERFDQWTRILKKDATIVIGARSAIFAPLDHLGLIVVDEEHDASYKQESGLRYHAGDLAVVRAKFNNSVALLGSATPSIQSCYNTRTQKFNELTLNRRVDDRPLPEIQVVDLSQTRDTRGVRRFVSPMLYDGMQQVLARQEQVLLFLNRRGYASFAVCAACGEVLKCKNCDISLTLHQDIHAYKCHYCGFTRSAGSACGACGSPKIKQLGLGTEKVEAAVKQLFPEARVARMDRDTTAGKGATLKILKRLRDRKIDILIGTQIIAKGHDFPNITLVGIICADLSLNFPDFRSGERTFQILAQVAGRAGRGDIPGRVILQTYNPDHFCIESARRQDFRGFYEREIRDRKSLNYPPYARLVHLQISGKNREETLRHAREIGAQCRTLRNHSKTDAAAIEILGPIEAPLSRISGRYRWQILFKGSTFKPVHAFIRRLMSDDRPCFATGRSRWWWMWIRFS